MSFFKKIFAPSSDNANNEHSGCWEVPVPFGRYTEVNKTPEQQAFWGNAQNDFSQQRYLDAFENLLKYIHDPKEQNVKINRKPDELEFELIQGSKIIRGKADQNIFFAEARIAQFDKPNVAFLRKLMNNNFTLQYTRFAINENIIYLKFDSKTIDASPNKIYYSLRELALKSDKMDDLLIREFETLHPIDSNHIIPETSAVVDLKYKYLLQWINETLNAVSTLNEDKTAGGISYLLLSLLYRIDCLLQPQGKLADDIERTINIYNDKDNKTTVERNRLMIEELRKITNLSKEEICKDFYRVKLTFGYVPMSSHKQFYEFVLQEFNNIPWYQSNNHHQVVTAIYEFIIGYSMFYFGLFPATYDFLELAYITLQPSFFRELGLDHQFTDEENNTLNKNAIEKQIQKIVNKHRKEYPKVDILRQNLKYNTLNDFLHTFLNELTYLNFTK